MFKKYISVETSSKWRFKRFTEEGNRFSERGKRGDVFGYEKMKKDKTKLKREMMQFVRKNNTKDAAEALLKKELDYVQNLF